MEDPFSDFRAFFGGLDDDDDDTGRPGQGYVGSVSSSSGLARLYLYLAWEEFSDSVEICFVEWMS